MVLVPVVLVHPVHPVDPVLPGGPRCSAPFTWRSSCPVGSVMCRTSDSLGSRRRRRSDGHLVKKRGHFAIAIARTCQNHALLMAWLCCDTVSYSYWLCLIIVIDCSMLEQEALLLLPHRSFFHEVVIGEVLKCPEYLDSMCWNVMFMIFIMEKSRDYRDWSLAIIGPGLAVGNPRTSRCQCCARTSAGFLTCVKHTPWASLLGLRSRHVYRSYALHFWVQTRFGQMITQELASSTVTWREIWAKRLFHHGLISADKTDFTIAMRPRSSSTQMLT